MKKYLYFSYIFLAAVLFSGCSMSPSSRTGAVAVPVGSIMKTADSGRTWEAKNKTADKLNLASIDILTMAINPYDNRNVFIGTLGNGIVKTDDAGESWSLLNFPASKVYGLVIDSMQSSTIYATGVWQGRGKIFKSVDSGKNWNEVYTAPSDGPLVISLAMDRINPSILYAGTSDKQLIKSVDSGTSWQSVLSVSNPVVKISMDSANANLIYVLLQGGDILKSTDGGKAFVGISEKISNGAETIEADPKISNVLYAGGKNGLFKSADAGGSWDELKTLSDPKTFSIKAVAINPANSNEITYGAAQAVYKSVDGGKNWSTFQLETKKTVNVIRYDESQAGIAYLGLRG